MKSVRICPQCNWEFPLSYTLPRCKFCKTSFHEWYCTTCNTFKYIDEFYPYMVSKCKRCNIMRLKEWSEQYAEPNAVRTKAHTDRRRAAAEELLASLPTVTSTKTLTEAEWLETCRYFGGCATCGNSHVESRQYFVPFSAGGRYTVWNVFPMCADCAKHLRLISNPFIWLDRRIGAKSLEGLTDERRERLIEFIKRQRMIASGSTI